jgi:hypothetical protein
VQKDLLWAGTDDGLIHISRDGGKNWTNVTPKGMPEWSLVSLIEASSRDAGTAYAAVDCHKLDDHKPYLYKTSDFGKTWTKITTGIPDGAYVHAVREDPKQKGLLYAGTETGVYVSFDDGAHWQTLRLNLPQTPIHDLIVKNNDLVVATHGRSFWILDDISPLRQLNPQAASQDMALYQPSTTYRLHWPEDYERRQPVGPNPPTGAVISYYFKAAPKGEVTLEILDSGGKVVREFSSVDKKKAETPPEWPDQQPPEEKVPVAAGMNRFSWDLRYQGPRELPGEVGAEFRNRGPMAMPGNYQVRLTANGKSLTAPLELKVDARVQISQADLQKQFDLELKIRDQLSDLHDAVREIRDTRTQLHTLDKRLEGDARYKATLTASQDLDKKMTPVEEQLLQVKAKSSEATLNYPVLIDEQLHSLAFIAGIADTAPTQPENDVFEELSRQASPLVAQWKQIMSTDVVALNEMMRKDNIPAIYLAPGVGAESSTKVAGQNRD